MFQHQLDRRLRISFERPVTDVTFFRSTKLLEAEVDDEIVALDRAQGKVFGFNGTASEIWRLLSSPKTIEALVDELSEKFEVDRIECEQDVSELLAQLVHLGLVVKEP